MTDQLHDETTDEATESTGINRRRMFIAGAGLAGAAALAKTGSAEAADPNDVTLDEVKAATTRTGVTNGGSNDGVPGTEGNEALYGDITEADNGSHAVRGITAGTGHAIAGETNNTANTVGATWGRHRGPGPGVDGVNVSTEDIKLAGTGNGVRGTVTSPSNGSHAVLGVTAGAGHSVAGDTPADAVGADEDGNSGTGVNTVAATWGRHQGIGAGIGGISIGGYGGEFVGGKASVRLIPSTDVESGPPADDVHLVGELFVDGEGDLYYNTADGANFTKLNGQGGVVMLDDAQRAFDSRTDYPVPANSNKGTFAANETRVIDLGEFTDVPASATGAIINLTVDRATDAGYATVFNGATADADRPNASSINWLPDTYTIANGIIVTVSTDNEVKVFATDPTEVIIDVVGYVS